MSLTEILVWCLEAAVVASLFFYASSSETKRRQMQARVAAQWQLRRAQFRDRLRNEEVALVLQRAGVPLTPQLFMYIRIALTFGTLAFGVFSLVVHHVPVFIVLPVIVWLITDAKASYSPLAMLFGRLSNLRKGVLNKDLYLMYRYLKLQLDNYSQNHRQRNVYDILEYVAPDVPRLSFAIKHCLNLWIHSPKEALDAFAADIGTEEAQDLARMLFAIEESEIDVALDVLNRRRETFQKTRIGLYKQKQEFRNMIGFTLASIGLGFMFIDFMTILQTYSNNLSQMSM